MVHFIKIQLAGEKNAGNTSPWFISMYAGGNTLICKTNVSSKFFKFY